MKYYSQVMLPVNPHCKASVMNSNMAEITTTPTSSIQYLSTISHPTQDHPKDENKYLATWTTRTTAIINTNTTTTNNNNMNQTEPEDILKQPVVVVMDKKRNISDCNSVVDSYDPKRHNYDKETTRTMQKNYDGSTTATTTTTTILDLDGFDFDCDFRDVIHDMMNDDETLPSSMSSIQSDEFFDMIKFDNDDYDDCNDDDHTLQSSISSIHSNDKSINDNDNNNSKNNDHHQTPCTASERVIENTNHLNNNSNDDMALFRYEHEEREEEISFPSLPPPSLVDDDNVHSTTNVLRNQLWKQSVKLELFQTNEQEQV